LNFPHTKTGIKGGRNNNLKRQGAMVAAEYGNDDVLLRRRA